MSKKCPNCEEKIEYLEVSQQIEGTLGLQEDVIKEPFAPIVQWKPPEEQDEPLIYTCPVCLAEIEDETLEEWGLK